MPYSSFQTKGLHITGFEPVQEASASGIALLI